MLMKITQQLFTPEPQTIDYQLNNFLNML